MTDREREMAEEFVSELVKAHNLSFAAPSLHKMLIEAWQNGRASAAEIGPPGTDRRWKLAAERAFGREFNTPQEMIDEIERLKRLLDRAVATVAHYTCRSCQDEDGPCFEYRSCVELRELREGRK